MYKLMDYYWKKHLYKFITVRYKPLPCRWLTDGHCVLNNSHSELTASDYGFKTQFYERSLNLLTTWIVTQLQKGIIELVPDEDSINSLKHYIPHHEIVTPEKTTTLPKPEKGLKAWMKAYTGPIILEDLCGFLMRFRVHKLVLIADVQKMHSFETSACSR